MSLTEENILQTLRRKKTDLLKEISKIDKAISALDKDESKEEIAWTIQALNCIKDLDRFVMTSDILKCLFEHNLKALDNPYKKRNYLVGLSVALNNLVTSKKLVKFSFVGLKGYKYGYPEWEEDGIIKEHYLAKLSSKVSPYYKKAI